MILVNICIVVNQVIVNMLNKNKKIKEKFKAVYVCCFVLQNE